MKFGTGVWIASLAMSPLTQAAWIEIKALMTHTLLHPGRRSLRRRGLKYHFVHLRLVRVESPLTQAAWIEIAMPSYIQSLAAVAAHSGGVD